MHPIAQLLHHASHGHGPAKKGRKMCAVKNGEIGKQMHALDANVW